MKSHSTTPRLAAELLLLVLNEESGDPLRVEGCQNCDELWDRYKVSVLEYTRLTSKMKLAKLRYERQIAELQNKLDEAGQARDEGRRQILEHERAVHPDTRLTAFE
jgi:hypothetical protein